MPRIERSSPTVVGQKVVFKNYSETKNSPEKIQNSKYNFNNFFK